MSLRDDVKMKTIHPSAYKYAAGTTMLQTPIGYLLRGELQTMVRADLCS